MPEAASAPRVLWLTKGLYPGGAEILMLELATHKAFAEYDIEVASVLTARHELVPAFIGAGVRVLDLGGKHTFDPTWVWHLIRIMSANRYNIVHAHSPLPASVARMVGRRLRPRPILVATEHNSRNAYSVLTRVINDYTAKHDDYRISVSAAAAESFPGESEVVYHGRMSRPPLASRASARTALGLSSDQSVIMTVANMRPEKNLELLIAAFLQVRDRIRGASLVLVGDGQERARIEAYVRRLGLEESVQLLGRRTDVSELLPAADVFAMSSRVEGIPVAVMEALQAGLPVVSTAVGGIPEIVQHGLNGLLAPAGSPEGLADALGLVLRDEELRTRLASGARSSISNFSVDSAATRISNIYRDLLDAH